MVIVAIIMAVFLFYHYHGQLHCHSTNIQMWLL